MYDAVNIFPSLFRYTSRDAFAKKKCTLKIYFCEHMAPVSHIDTR